jgi:8-oxo-dGTP diphosphatase
MILVSFTAVLLHRGHERWNGRPAPGFAASATVFLETIAGTIDRAARHSNLAALAALRHRIDMADSAKTRALILAAGGIVLRQGAKPRIAVVRLRRDKSWVLPKGKLNSGEEPIVAAKREVMEETGYEVSVHEFLGSMSYAVEGKIKIVQFWLMRAAGRPVRELMHDVKAVKWLSLKQAVETLSRAHEKVFLAHVGRIALAAARRAGRSRSAKAAPGASRRAPVAPAHLFVNGFGRKVVVKSLSNRTTRLAQPARRAS